jgi:hypothetical protein
MGVPHRAYRRVLLLPFGYAADACACDFVGPLDRTPTPTQGRPGGYVRSTNCPYHDATIWRNPRGGMKWEKSDHLCINCHLCKKLLRGALPRNDLRSAGGRGRGGFPGSVKRPLKAIEEPARSYEARSEGRVAYRSGGEPRRRGGGVAPVLGGWWPPVRSMGGSVVSRGRGDAGPIAGEASGSRVVGTLRRSGSPGGSGWGTRTSRGPARAGATAHGSSGAPVGRQGCRR